MKYLVFLLCIMQISALTVNVTIGIPSDAPYDEFELNCSNYTVISASEFVYEVVVQNSTNSTNSTTNSTRNSTVVTPVVVADGLLVVWYVVGAFGGVIIGVLLYNLLIRRRKQPVFSNMRDPTAIKISMGRSLLSGKDL
jgi:beta-lactamase regulating signal transducer with metallopeptidase domain